jgi:hypothetical protein
MVEVKLVERSSKDRTIYLSNSRAISRGFHVWTEPFQGHVWDLEIESDSMSWSVDCGCDLAPELPWLSSCGNNVMPPL